MRYPVKKLNEGLAAFDDRESALRIRLQALRSRVGGRFAKYRNDPVGYANDVLGVKLWGRIADVLKALLEPPYMVSVDSGHGTGKTHCAALAVNWWYDTRDPCWVITTAPTDRDVKQVLWTEIRLQRQNAVRKVPFDLMPAASEMRSGPDHMAVGYTARDVNSAQGRHRRNMLFLFDEKEGVQAPFWDGMKSMMRPGSGDAALVAGNPFNTASRAYFEHKSVRPDGSPKWHRVRLSSLDHPNIAAHFRGEPLPMPDAVTAGQVENWLADWTDPVPLGDERPTDIEWPPRGFDTPDRPTRYFRPGPVGEPRILGLRPSAGTYGVWSEAAFALTLGPPPPVPPGTVPVVGCDCAQFGDDYTCVHTRCGPVSLRHEAGNGWDHLRIADRLRQAAHWAADWFNARRDPASVALDPKAVPINLDDDATGRAVLTVLARDGFNVRGVNAGSSPGRPDLYPNKRSELWFLAAKKAATGGVNLSQIPAADRQRIEQQLLAPEWWPDAAGRRVVEDKLQTKKKLGRSPDDADAVNLSYYEPVSGEVPTVVGTDRRETRQNWRERGGRR